MKRAAFFDLDRTLLLKNSGKLWFRRERAEGRIRLHQALEAGAWLGLSELGLLRAHTALDRAVRGLRGQSEEDIADRTRRFFDEEIGPIFAPGGLAAVEAHKAVGDPVVLLTSSSNYLGHMVQEHLGLEDVLSMRFEVEDGIFTGRIEQLCYHKPMTANRM